jgi:hypothetical protein
MDDGMRGRFHKEESLYNNLTDQDKENIRGIIKSPGKKIDVHRDNDGENELRNYSKEIMVIKKMIPGLEEMARRADIRQAILWQNSIREMKSIVKNMEKNEAQYARTKKRRTKAAS